ncbi:MAG: adenylosuccinate lyase [Anaerolineaceae bacterium]|nr:adenylosuccinate lyase [Anaerolineaceae bacterium]
MLNPEIYQSPFSWRYGSDEMRYIWSEKNKRKLWRKLWVALAQVQVEYGLVTKAQIEELQKFAGALDLERSLEIESEIHHDLMAELLAFAEQCPTAGGILHLGATSMDIEDNTDAIRLRQSLIIILNTLHGLLLQLADFINKFAEIPVMAFTHLQPAEPTTLGYRFAFYAQDLMADWQLLTDIYHQIKGKGFKGAVGTGASYAELIGLQNYRGFEQKLADILALPFFPISNQTYPRRQDYQALSSLAGMGSTLYKLSFDLRILQSPPIGELSEPFGKKQVGSSAMPFKRNPIQAEKVNSLARNLAQMPLTAWHNAAHSLLERTLDDSANRRSLLPEAFLSSDEILRTCAKMVSGLKINTKAIQKNMAVYAPFSSTERLMMALAGSGANRQELHARIREHALNAWESVQSGRPNPLAHLISNDPEFTQYFSPEELQKLMTVEEYFGVASQQARVLSEQIRRLLTSSAALPSLKDYNWTA